MSRRRPEAIRSSSAAPGSCAKLRSTIALPVQWCVAAVAWQLPQCGVCPRSVGDTVYSRRTLTADSNWTSLTMLRTAVHTVRHVLNTQPHQLLYLWPSTPSARSLSWSKSTWYSVSPLPCSLGESSGSGWDVTAALQPPGSESSPRAGERLLVIQKSSPRPSTRLCPRNARVQSCSTVPCHGGGYYPAATFGATNSSTVPRHDNPIKR